MKTTQYEVIGRLLKRKAGATTRDLIEASGSVCPWKRMGEMKRRGWVIWSKWSPGKKHGTYYGTAPERN